MSIASALKCAPSPDEKQLINDLIESLGLFSVRHTQTKRLSGGQKKRLAIGLELVNNPPVSFLIYAERVQQSLEDSFPRRLD